MTAHWGIEDPAPVQGTDIEKERAFSTAARYMKSRIGAFLGVACSVHRSNGDGEATVRSIGQMEGSTAKKHLAGCLSRRSSTRRSRWSWLKPWVPVSLSPQSSDQASWPSSLTDDIALWRSWRTRSPRAAALAVLISVLGPIPGAHFNPAVSLVMATSVGTCLGETARPISQPR